MSLSPPLIQSQIDTTILFKNLPSEVRTAIAKVSRPRPFKVGEGLLCEGRPNSMLYLIVTGRVNVWTEADGVMVALKTLGPGDYFGEVGFIGGGRPATATVEAIHPGTALTFHRDEMTPLLTTHPSVLKVLRQLTLHRAKATIKKIAGEP
ncbi:MAG: cyclic nucleotide-binding domain-containing protein [Myxococcota bacterium]